MTGNPVSSCRERGPKMRLAWYVAARTADVRLLLPAFEGPQPEGRHASCLGWYWRNWTNVREEERRR